MEKGAVVWLEKRWKAKEGAEMDTDPFSVRLVPVNLGRPIALLGFGEVK